MQENSHIQPSIALGGGKMKRELWDAEHFCHICKGRMDKAKVMIQGMPVRAWECRKCRETVLHPEDAQRTLVFSKLKKGVPVRVGKLGEALMVRLPKEFAQFYGIAKGGDLIFRAEDNHRFEVKVG